MTGQAIARATVVCRDGVELVGFRTTVIEARGVLLHIPGQYDNALQRERTIVLLRHAIASGLSCVFANTRGQDGVTFMRRHQSTAPAKTPDWIPLGSSFERVAEGDLDIDAWLDHCAEMFPGLPIGLVGHSHGAIKVALYLATTSRRRTEVTAAALLSPSDDIEAQHTHLGARFDAALVLASKLKASEFMPSWTYWAPMSAGTYLEGFGDESPLDVFRFVTPERSLLRRASAWRVPTFVCFGLSDAATANVSSAHALEVIRLDLVPGSEGIVLSDGDHHYTGAEDEAAAALTGWLTEALV